MDCPNIKPLASWKVWWTNKEVADVAKEVHKNLVISELPGKATIVTLAAAGKVSECDFDHPCNSAVAEGLLRGYPRNRQGSAYFFGDAVLFLNDVLMKGAVLGEKQVNPMKEDQRRESALKEGAKWKLLISYVRQKASRHETSNKKVLTFLKSLSGRAPTKSPTSSSSAALTPSEARDGKLTCMIRM